MDLWLVVNVTISCRNVSIVLDTVVVRSVTICSCVSQYSVCNCVFDSIVLVVVSTYVVPLDFISFNLVWIYSNTPSTFVWNSFVANFLATSFSWFSCKDWYIISPSRILPSRTLSSVVASSVKQTSVCCVACKILVVSSNLVVVACSSVDSFLFSSFVSSSSTVSFLVVSCSSFNKPCISSRCFVAISAFSINSCCCKCFLANACCASSTWVCIYCKRHSISFQCSTVIAPPPPPLDVPVPAPPSPVADEEAPIPDVFIDIDIM